MSPEKAMATALFVSESMANKNNLQSQIYNRPSYLSSSIDLLLGNLLFALHWPHLNKTEKAMVLDCVDGLSRLKVDLRQDKGVRGGS